MERFFLESKIRDSSSTHLLGARDGVVGEVVVDLGKL